MKDYGKLFSGMADDAGEKLKKIQNKKKSNEQTAEKPERVGKTSFQKRREKRIQKRAERRAKRSGTEKNSEQFNANVEAEKDLIEQRRLKRKQFLRDFASNLAGVEQRTVRGTMQTQDMSDSFGKQPQSSAEKAQQVEQAQEEENIKNKFSAFTSSANEGLGDIGFSFNPYDSFKKS
jgi:hypothetical protein